MAFWIMIPIFLELCLVDYFMHTLTIHADHMSIQYIDCAQKWCNFMLDNITVGTSVNTKVHGQYP